MVEPDILIVDEVLAVGDLAFQLKCFDRMSQLREAGTTIVLVSHALRAIQRLCPRTLVLHQGAIRFDGDTSEAIGVYHDALSESRDIVDEDVLFTKGRTVDPCAEVESFELLGPDGRPTRHVSSGEEVAAVLTVRFVRSVEGPITGLNILSEGKILVYAHSTPWDERTRYEAGTRARFVARFRARLAPGSYTVRMALMTATNTLLTPSARPLLFYVDGPDRVKGFADLGASFQVSTSSVAEDSPDAAVSAMEGPAA
jgi:hypothetical protein